MNKRTILAGIVFGAAFALVMVAVFSIGILVGSQRERRFFPFWERRRVFHDYIPRKLNGHGVIGTIDSLAANTLIVKDRMGALKTVVTDDQTRIRRGYMPINFSDLKKDDQVIILGDPQEEEGVIKAKVIRVISNFGKEATKSGVGRPL